MNSFFIFLNKPVGLTSQQALTQFKRKFKFDKIGHHGTLDPFATGLLLVGVNEATKFFQYVNDEKKTYLATLKLGSETDTLDHTGSVTAESTVPDFSSEQIKSVLKMFLGASKQMPPMYSAIKIQGKKLYELARNGETVERKEREIFLHALDLVNATQDEITVSATVSRGTYIRVLATDIAKKMGTLAHLKSLTRETLCGFSIKDSFDLSENEIPDEKKIAIQNLLTLPKIPVTDEARREISFGRPVPGFDQENGPCQIIHNSEFLGVGEIQNNLLKALRLMSKI